MHVKRSALVTDHILVSSSSSSTFVRLPIHIHPRRNRQGIKADIVRKKHAQVVYNSECSTLLGALKLPFLSSSKARSKRAPKAQATPNYMHC